MRLTFDLGLDAVAAAGGALPSTGDRDPYRSTGDGDIMITYAAVGEAMARWESFELALANLYSRFVGYPYWLAKVRHFATCNRSFAQRLTAIEAAAAKFHALRADTDDEAAFRDICRRGALLAELRDRIAHGMVVGEDDADGAVSFRLCLPWHMRCGGADSDGMGSDAIRAVSAAFVDLAAETDALNARYAGCRH